MMMVTLMGCRLPALANGLGEFRAVCVFRRAVDPSPLLAKDARNGAPGVLLWAGCGAAGSRALSKPIAPFPAVTNMGREGRGGFKIKIKIEFKIKGNGQECPFHTSGRLKPILYRRALRGAEAPLFHVTARVRDASSRSIGDTGCRAGRGGSRRRGLFCEVLLRWCSW